MSDRIVGILTLSEPEYLEEDEGAGELEWTIPCGRQGAPVAFVVKGYGEGGGQRVMAFGRVARRSRRKKRGGIRSFWYCDDIVWLRRHFSQDDFSPQQRNLVGKLGGFASYRLHGIGAGIRSRDSWNAFVQAVQRRNPRIDLSPFCA